MVRNSGEKEKMGFLQGYTRCGLHQGVRIMSVLAVITAIVGRVRAASLLGFHGGEHPQLADVRRNEL